MNTRQQLELSFKATETPASLLRQNRRARARWWFEQMRRCVDQAFDWHAAPPARPEQTFLLPSGSR